MLRVVEHPITTYPFEWERGLFEVQLCSLNPRLMALSHGDDNKILCSSGKTAVIGSFKRAWRDPGAKEPRKGLVIAA